MSAAKHTPGPWGVLDSGSLIYVRSASRDQICGIPRRKNPRASDERYANARLIAAAPELLAACEAALARFDESIRGARPSVAPLEYAAILRAAIAKARGGAR